MPNHTVCTRCDHAAEVERLTVERDKYKAFAEQGAAESAPALARVCQFLGWPIFGDHVEMAQKLAAELAELRRVATSKTEVERLGDCSQPDKIDEISLLKIELAELREDRERLEWWVENSHRLELLQEMNGWSVYDFEDRSVVERHETPRAAIDAARKVAK